MRGAGGSGGPQPSPEVGPLCEGADPAHLLSWLCSSSCGRVCKLACDQKFTVSKTQPLVAKHRTFCKRTFLRDYSGVGALQAVCSEVRVEGAAELDSSSCASICKTWTE